MKMLSWHLEGAVPRGVSLPPGLRLESHQSCSHEPWPFCPSIVNSSETHGHG